MFDFDRAKRLWWHIDFALPEDSPFLLINVVIENKESTKQSLYCWINSAVYQDEQTRIFASSPDALYLDTDVQDHRLFGFMTSPDCPLVGNKDCSYPWNFPLSDEYFFTCNHDAMPWEVGMQSDGTGFFEASTRPLAYRKMFCWGQGEGSKHWQRYLSPERSGEYVELQAGLAPSQLHAMWIEPGERFSFTQAMGAIVGDGTGDYAEARSKIVNAVNRLMPLSLMEHYASLFIEPVTAPTMLHQGTGWTVLEGMITSPGDAYPLLLQKVPSVLEPWKQFLTDGTLPSYDSLHLPPVTGDAWEKRLQEGNGDKATKAYYLGVIKGEQGKTEEAIAQFLMVYAMKHDSVSARNIAVLSQALGDDKEAFEWYQLAAKAKFFYDDPAIAEEYLNTLIVHGRIVDAHALLHVFTVHFDTARLRLIAALQGNSEKLKKLLDQGFSDTREGDTPYDALYLSYLYLVYGQGLDHTEAMDKALLSEHPMPFAYQFNMFRNAK